MERRPNVAEEPWVFVWGGTHKDGGCCGGSSEPAHAQGLMGSNVKQITCSNDGESLFALTAQGKVRQWGPDEVWRKIKQKQDPLRQDEAAHSLLLLDKPVVEIASGQNHFAAVTSDGALYTWGDGDDGKLGHGNEISYLDVPTQVQALAGIPIKQVVCGQSHTVALAANGKVYTWGWNGNGQTGHGVADGNEYLPRLVKEGDDFQHKCVAQISCSDAHTAAVTTEGELFVWGFNGHGELGSNDTNDSPIPQQVKDPFCSGGSQRIKIIMVSCGGNYPMAFNHTVALTEEGQLYTFGYNDYGQLGHDDTEHKHKPTLVEAVKNIRFTQISCGFHHCVALTNTGQVYSWGYGVEGQLGHGGNQNEFAPRLVERLQERLVVGVAASGHHTIAFIKPSGSLPGDSVPVHMVLGNMLNDSTFADVSFLVGNDEDKPIYAHRAILAQRCDFFNRMFNNGMMQESVQCNENSNKPIVIRNVRRHIFLQLLKYLYLDALYVDIEDAIELYAMADMYHLNRLQSICLASVVDNLTVENAAHLLQRVDEEANDTVLKQPCLDFVVQHLPQVSKTPGFQQLSRELLLEIVPRHF